MFLLQHAIDIEQEDAPDHVIDINPEQTVEEEENLQVSP